MGVSVGLIYKDRPYIRVWFHGPNKSSNFHFIVSVIVGKLKGNASFFLEKF